MKYTHTHTQRKNEPKRNNNITFNHRVEDREYISKQHCTVDSLGKKRLAQKETEQMKDHRIISHDVDDDNDKD